MNRLHLALIVLGKLIVIPAIAADAETLTADLPTRESKSARAQARMLRFPADRSVGRVSVYHERSVDQIQTFFHWGRDWQRQSLGRAQGQVRVPAGAQVSLSVNKTGWREMSWVAELRRDDLAALSFEASSMGRVRPSDQCMSAVAHLTGLRSLDLGSTDVTDRGFTHVRRLRLLEYLDVSPRVTDGGMVHVAQLPLIRGLYFDLRRDSRVTDAGLRHLARLRFLEELALSGERMSDAGLAHLRDLPGLAYLMLYGSRFTDAGCEHLKDISSLRILSFYEGKCPVTDAGLAQLAELPRLESLLLDVGGRITDAGIAHLAQMPSLRKLDICTSKVTDRGLGYLKRIKTLEHLELPQAQEGITDVGIAHLAELPNLRCLHISRVHYVNPEMNKEYYTDQGLAALAHCTLLEDLSIGSPGITDAGMDHVARLTKLRRLNLFGCDNVTDAGLRKLTALPSLGNLYVSEADATVAGVNELGSLTSLTHLKVSGLQRGGAVLDLSRLVHLEDLGLSFERGSSDAFTDADLACLAQLRRLERIQIGPRDFSDSGLAYLAGLTDLNTLGIGGSNLTDAGLAHLTGMKRLQLLTISSGHFDRATKLWSSGGNVTDAGLRVLESLPELKFLEIYSDSEFSLHAVRRLRAALPDMYRLNLNGRDALVVRPAAHQPSSSTFEASRRRRRRP